MKKETIWEQLEKKPLFSVQVRNGQGSFSEYYETPEDQAKRDDEPQENLYRVFLKKEEADRYMDSIAVHTNTSPNRLRAVSTNLENIVAGFVNLDRSSKLRHGIPARIDLCKMNRNEWPKTLETLLSPSGNAS